MYIETTLELRHELEARRQSGSEIRARIEAWAERKYRITRYWDLVHDHFPFMRQGGVFGILARQLPSVTVEDICCFIGSRHLGLNPVALAFTRDTFNYSNADKHYRVKVPWHSVSKKGNPMMAFERIVAADNNALMDVPLNEIVTRDGRTLPEYHAELRRSVFNGAYPVQDFSRLHNMLLRAAVHRPREVYAVKDGKEVKLPTTDDVFSGELRDTLRAPARWYYPIFLSWFLSGELVLFETFYSQKMSAEFREAVSTFERVIGYRPMVVGLPISQDAMDMLYVPKALLGNPALLEHIPSAFPEELPIPKGFRQIADRVLALR